MTMTLEQNAMRRDRSALVAALESAGAVMERSGGGFRCPWHSDEHASGSIHQDEGAWKFKCHTCGVHGDVFDALARAKGIDVSDVLREVRGATEKPKAKQPRVFPSIQAMVDSVRCWSPVEDVYVYTNPKTRKPEMVVIRHLPPDNGGKKKFLQARPTPSGFILNAPDKPWPLFNRIEVRDTPVVVVVEGEKKVKALRSVGIVATTSPGGAKNAKNANWGTLCGKEEIILWRDNDEAGKQYMADVAEQLERLALPPLKIREVDVAALELPESGDVVDYLAGYDGEDATDKQRAVNMVLDLAREVGATDELSTLIEDTIAGKRMAVDWPWPILGESTQALLPGTVTCVCGDPGGTKSLLLLEAAWRWHADGVKVAVYELEDDRAFHLNRMLAQLAENSNLTRAKWVRENPDLSRESLAKFRGILRSFRPWIWDAPETPPRLPELIEWVEARASEGCRVIIIDPITAAANEDKQFLADQQFVLRIKAVARRHACSVIVVTHPRIAHKGKVLDGLAGGAAYPRFAQTVLWVSIHEKPKSVKMRHPMHGVFHGVINRSVRIGKSRNGDGGGSEIGFHFDGKSLRIAEQGIVMGDSE